MLFGPLRCEGVGLSDGETMERMWSYLRRFGKMTKEMRPAHRRDVLTHALVNYGMKAKEKLGMIIIIILQRHSGIINVLWKELTEHIIVPLSPSISCAMGTGTASQELVRRDICKPDCWKYEDNNNNYEHFKYRLCLQVEISVTKRWRSGS